MRSRAVRLTCAAVALIALGLATFFVLRSEQHLAMLRAGGRAFDLHAREITAALSDLRAGQQAYVAAGQGVTFWMPKVAQTAATIRSSMTTLQSAATSTAAESAVIEAANTLTAFTDIDSRARDYLRSGQLLMAGDVIFTEGDQTAAAAARSVESARLAEHQALDAAEAATRNLQAIAIAAAGGTSALMVLLLGATGASKSDLELAMSIAAPAETGIAHAAAASAPPPPRAVSPILKDAAQLCTDFACVRDVSDVQMLLGRASDAMDAAGMIVWLASADSSGLQPVLAHGYSDDTRARLPVVPRSANNAAAAAYRSGHMQIVLSRPGGAKGAVVAPIIGAQGCIGALSAEIRSGGEGSDGVHALASIVASQLASVLATAQPDIPEQRAAASS